MKKKDELEMNKAASNFTNALIIIMNITRIAILINFITTNFFLLFHSSIIKDYVITQGHRHGHTITHTDQLL